MDTSQKIQEYEGFFEKIFDELEKEINCLTIRLSNPFVFEIQSINGCKNITDFRVKLVILRGSTILTLNRILKEIAKEEKITFLRILIIKVEEMLSEKFKRVKLECKSKENNEFEDISLDSDHTIEISEMITIQDKINKYEKIWIETIKELKPEIESIIENIKQEEEDKNLIKSEKSDKLKTEICWEGNDTELIELVTALYEGGYINNKKENLSRKDAFIFFGNIFNQPMKDAESKLSKAIAIRKDPTPFLDNLIKAFIGYREEKFKLKQKNK